MNHFCTRLATRALQQFQSSSVHRPFFGQLRSINMTSLLWKEASEVKVSRKFAKLKKNQLRFQVDDGKPIFLKGGFKDKILYQFTWVLIIVAFVMQVQLFYSMGFAKK